MDKQIKDHLLAEAEKLANSEYELQCRNETWLICIASTKKAFPLPSSCGDVARAIVEALKNQYKASVITAFERTWATKEPLIGALEILRNHELPYKNRVFRVEEIINTILEK